MARINTGGYVGKIARIDLNAYRVTCEFPEEDVLRKYVGGTGLGAYFLYREVLPGTQWCDSENRFILMTGPLAGAVGPTGTYSVVTKGPMNNGPAAAQANGRLGAFLKFSGLDGLIIQGVSDRPVYLYVHDGMVEIREARHLEGKDTWETAEAIEKELGRSEQQVSILAIGPAGENLVRFACTVSDRGHVCAHNGPGAVLGSKRVKAIAVERGTLKVPVYDREAARRLVNRIIENKAKKDMADLYNWGTSRLVVIFDEIGILPIKNYTSAEGLPYYRLDGTYYRERFEMRRTLCWGCRFRHCHMVKVTEGPYAGYVGEEPEYECLAAWGPLIGQTDPGAAVVLTNLVDRLGLDANEAGWVISWIMECYEKGLLTTRDTDGLEMTWGNVEAVKQMLKNIAYRRGFGALLAEGLMRAATRIGGEAAKMGIYTMKGNTPRCHDHRPVWNMILDTVTASIGTDEVSAMLTPPVILGLPGTTDRNTPEGAAAIVAAAAKRGVKMLADSLPVCYLGLAGATPEDFAQLLSAVTGWQYSAVEASTTGFRIHNLLRAFGVRHGHSKDMDQPSPRYASAALKGPAAGRSLYAVWAEARDDFYRNMGWDVATGVPLPSTLEAVGLGFTVSDLWK